MIGHSRMHLAEVGETYLEHMRFAASVGGLMMAAGAACLIHALVPGLFQDKASRTIRRLHRAIERRDALEPFVARGEEADGLATLVVLALLAAAMPWLLGAEAALAFPLSLLSLAFPVAAFHAAAQVHMDSQAISITVPASTGSGLSG